MSRTCLVTGGAGFIGSAIVRVLLEQGARVRVLDNLSTGSLENLPSPKNDLYVMEGDIRDTEQVAEAVANVDLIFHQAAFVSAPLSLEQPQTCFEINVRGTLNVLEAARDAGARRVVLASSAAVYGDTLRMPLTEASPLTSLSPYAASKRTNEVYADLYTRAMGLDVVALRYFNVYGPRQSAQSAYAAVIPIFIQRMGSGKPPVIYGDGGQSRDFVYVRDVARANVRAGDAETAPGGVFNICSGEEMTVNQLAATLREIIPGSPDPRHEAERPGDIYRSVGDPGLASDVLGFQPQVSFTEGLTQTVSWMEKQGFEA
jgi:UDP-glucose 4-epimerase